MGGGDLNTKKSWHPNTMKNQERVWKAEQQEAAEKRRLTELRREIDEERNREELKNMAKKSGVLPGEDGDDKKLEWMYRGPSQLVNREEYLLGRAIDKTFEDLDAQEKASNSTFGVAQPKNHVEHECIPFSIRQHKDVLSNDQVDLARKLMEDPLMLIKQKEIESRQKILQNPVKLKELHRLLKGDQSLRDRRSSESKKSKKKDKKAKKSKKSHKKKKGKGKRHSGSSESGSDSECSADLDKLLAEKYKKVAGEHQEGVNIDRLLTMKYDKLSKELDIMGGGGSKKKKHHRRDRSGSESDVSDADRRKRDDNRHGRRDEPKRNDRDRRSGDRARSSNKERSKEVKKGARRDSSAEEYAHDRRRERKPDDSLRNRSRSRSGDRHRNKPAQRTNNRSPARREQPSKSRYVRDRSRSRSNERRTHARETTKRRSRSRSPRRRSPPPPQPEQTKRPAKPRRTPSDSSSTSGSDSDERQPQRQLDSDEERRARKVRNFGLVTASGEKLEMKAQPDVRLYKREEIRAEQSKQRPTWSKTTERKRPLTEQELEEKRLAMMSNAQWREKERESNVKRYEAEDHREESKQGGREYDKEFLTKQFKRAAANETVESRIRSNRNNIQRSNGAMDRNFVKR